MNEVAPKEENKVVEIFPLTKWKRSLSFLADFFLVFIATLLFFHLAAYPLGKVAVGYETRRDEYVSSIAKRDSVLYGNGLLYSLSEQERTNANFSLNLDFTFRAFVYHFVKDAVTYPPFEGFEGDVFHTYFVTLRGEEVAYRNTYLQYAGNLFFTVGETVALNPVFHEEFVHAYVVGDDMSELGKTHFQMLQEGFFLSAYRDMLRDIANRDLTFNGISYKAEQTNVQKFIVLEENLAITTTFIAYFLGCATVVFLLPMANKNRKTLAMLFMRTERIDQQKLVLVKRRRVLLLFPYQLVANLGLLFFVPLGVYDIVNLMSLPILLPVSAISLLFVLASFIAMMFDYYNRTLMDRFSQSVMVSQATLDEIYRAKGYVF